MNFNFSYFISRKIDFTPKILQTLEMTKQTANSQTVQTRNGESSIVHRHLKTLASLQITHKMTMLCSKRLHICTLKYIKISLKYNALIQIKTKT